MNYRKKKTFCINLKQQFCVATIIATQYFCSCAKMVGFVIAAQKIISDIGSTAVQKFRKEQEIVKDGT